MEFQVTKVFRHLNPIVEIGQTASKAVKVPQAMANLQIPPRIIHLETIRLRGSMIHNIHDFSI